MEPISTTIILILALWMTYRYHCRTSPAYDTETARRVHAFNLAMAGVAIVVVFVVALKWTALVTLAAVLQIGILIGRQTRPLWPDFTNTKRRLMHWWDTNNPP